jgi:carbon storage regulator
MLVLSRKPGERIFVGEEVELVVVEVRGDRVKLGFNAPRCVPIQRSEIHGQREGWYPALEHSESA